MARFPTELHVSSNPLNRRKQEQLALVCLELIVEAAFYTGRWENG
jgi:hypothetical protein